MECKYFVLGIFLKSTGHTVRGIGRGGGLCGIAETQSKSEDGFQDAAESDIDTDDSRVEICELGRSSCTANECSKNCERTPDGCFGDTSSAELSLETNESSVVLRNDASSLSLVIPNPVWCHVDKSNLGARPVDKRLASKGRKRQEGAAAEVEEEMLLPESCSGQSSKHGSRGDAKSFSPHCKELASGAPVRNMILVGDDMRATTNITLLLYHI